MPTKIKKYLEQLPWHMFRDVRAIGLLTFLVIVLLISWSGVKVIESNYALQQQISALQQQNQVQELENNNSKLQNEYYNTNQYLELSARQNFGLAAPGETELLVPKNVALAHIQNVQTIPTTTTTTASSHEPSYQRNLQAWVDFYLHRPYAGD